MSDLPFEGLKVIDNATVMAAPAAAMMLADFGADVIKVEPPGGDMLRLLSHIPSTPQSGSDWFWQLDGRNKRAITLDLSDAAGREILLQLISACDVYITNQPAEVRRRLGLTYDELARVNPRMIYASLTAYGEDGPESDRKGFDQLAYWARSGLMDLMREPGTRPTQGLPGMGDHPTGVALYASIVTALLQRERTGRGGLAHTSLLANGLWSAAGIAQGVMAGGDMPGYRESNRVPAAMMRPYRTRDGRWLQFNMIRNEELLGRLLAALDVPELLADPRFVPERLFDNREAFGDALQAAVARRTSDDWLARFAELDLPVNRIALIEECATDEQILANEMAVAPPEEFDEPLLIRHPVNAGNASRVEMRRAPRPNEHGEAILTELGYDAAAIAELRAAGTLG